MSDAQASVDAARALRLDSKRIEVAKRRASAALEIAKHHERQARAERERAATIARTWGFDLDDL